MKFLRTTLALAALSLVVLLSSCGAAKQKKAYNDGVNIIPVPSEMTLGQGAFTLKSGTSISAASAEAKTIANFFAAKIALSTGYNNSVVESGGDIELIIDGALDLKAEGYKLSVTADKVTVTGKDAAGLFYGMQSFLQLLPAEITSLAVVNDVEWSAAAAEITDEPRFGYRGIMLDVCRHFMPVDFIKKQIDILSMFKINRLHWHLTEDQAWRIEIKKYPRLAEVGSTRVEADGKEYGGFYTQDQVKEIVAYAAERFITVVPEFELPGHELAAIAAYPELSCKGEAITPRIIWGVEDIVMCPAKEITMQFIEDVIEEMVPLFPGEYFHIGGDECPKTSWAKCPACQQLIRKEGLQAKDGHSAEERLQSYVIGKVEGMLMARGKKLVGWDEILEGGLSPNATVMSWRGEDGGIAAAKMGHDVVMTPNGGGLYIDHYQGDYKIEPVGIGGYAPLSKTYSYDPMPKALVEIGADKHVMGVQANLWTEYMYTTDIMEYRLYPRALAVAEIGWSKLDKKNFDDFSRRINNAYVRMDSYGVNYHIPQPEQPGGSTNFVAFTDVANLEFTTTRPVKMFYTTDGSTPTVASTEYTAPIAISETTTLKIATILPSGKTSPVRTITVEKQTLKPATEVAGAVNGLKMSSTAGTYLNRAAFEKASAPVKESVIKDLDEIVIKANFSESFRKLAQAANVAEGYINIAEDGVYHFWSNNNDVWIDGELLIDNNDEVKRFSRASKSVALAKGLHTIKVVWLGNLLGGWPTNWDDGAIMIRKEGEEKERKVTAEEYFYAK